MPRSRFETERFRNTSQKNCLHRQCSDVHAQIWICVFWIFRAGVRAEHHSYTSYRLWKVRVKLGEPIGRLSSGIVTVRLEYIADLLLGWIDYSTFFLSGFCCSSGANGDFRFSIYIPSQSSGSRSRLMQSHSLLSLSELYRAIFYIRALVGNNERKIELIKESVNERERHAIKKKWRVRKIYREEETEKWKDQDWRRGSTSSN